MNLANLKLGQVKQDERKKGTNRTTAHHINTLAVYLDHSQNPEPQGDF